MFPMHTAMQQQRPVSTHVVTSVGSILGARDARSLLGNLNPLHALDVVHAPPAIPPTPAQGDVISHSQVLLHVPSLSSGAELSEVFTLADGASAFVRNSRIRFFGLATNRVTLPDQVAAGVQTVAGAVAGSVSVTLDGGKAHPGDYLYYAYHDPYDLAAPVQARPRVYSIRPFLLSDVTIAALGANASRVQQDIVRMLEPELVGALQLHGAQVARLLDLEAHQSAHATHEDVLMGAIRDLIASRLIGTSYTGATAGGFLHMSLSLPCIAG
jgi:hypothetical protein